MTQERWPPTDGSATDIPRDDPQNATDTAAASRATGIMHLMTARTALANDDFASCRAAILLAVGTPLEEYADDIATHNALAAAIDAALAAFNATAADIPEIPDGNTEDLVARTAAAAASAAAAAAQTTADDAAARAPTEPPAGAAGQNKVWKTDARRVAGWREDATGGPGGASSFGELTGRATIEQLPDGVSVFPVYLDGGTLAWSDKVYAPRALVTNDGIAYLCILTTQGKAAAETEPGTGTAWQTYWIALGADDDFPLGLEDAVNRLQLRTADLIPGPESTGWANANSGAQGGIALNPSALDLSAVEALPANRWANSQASPGSNVMHVRVPVATDARQVRIAFAGSSSDEQYHEAVSAMQRLGADDDWAYYRDNRLIGPGVTALTLQVTGSAAHVGASTYLGNLSPEKARAAVGEVGTPVAAHDPAEGDGELAGLDIAGTDYEIVDEAGRVRTANVDRAAKALADELHGLGISTITVTGTGWRDAVDADGIRVGYTGNPGGVGAADERQLLSALTVGSNRNNVTPIIWLPHGMRPEGVRYQRVRGGATTTYPAAGQYWREYTTGGRLAEDTFHLTAYHLASESSDARIALNLNANDVVKAQVHPLEHELAVPWDHITDKTAATFDFEDIGSDIDSRTTGNWKSSGVNLTELPNLIYAGIETADGTFEIVLVRKSRIQDTSNYADDQAFSEDQNYYAIEFPGRGQPELCLAKTAAGVVLFRIIGHSSEITGTLQFMKAVIS